MIGPPHFIRNKYRRWYFQIIDAARLRAIAGHEKHHTLPRSLGGTRFGGDIVSLTFREHFLAHWLLTKFTSGPAKKRMHFALWSMTRNRSVTSWQYAKARVAHRLVILGNKSALGHKHSDGAKSAIRAAHTGRKFTEEHKRRIGDANRGKVRLSPQKKSEETRMKMRKPKSQEHRLKISAALKGNKRALGHRHSEGSKAIMSAKRMAAAAVEAVESL